MTGNTGLGLRVDCQPRRIASLPGGRVSEYRDAVALHAAEEGLARAGKDGVCELHRLDGLCQTGGGGADLTVLPDTIDEVAVLLFRSTSGALHNLRHFSFEEDLATRHTLHTCGDVLSVDLVSLEARARCVVSGQLGNDTVFEFDQGSVDVPVG